MKRPAFDRFLKMCEFCRKATPHEIRTCPGMKVTICVSCLERALGRGVNRVQPR